MSSLDGLESVAKMLVSSYARTTLYPTDTPRVVPEILVSVTDGDGSFLLLNTNLPDGVIYTVTREDHTVEPILTAYKKLDDLQVH